MGCLSFEMKIEGDEGLRTLDCLRGRLLAERQASRLAKQDAELLGIKLVELEKKLKEEEKLGKKADKRLKFLMRKLESLTKNSPTLEGSDENSSGFSCSSCTSTNSDANSEKIHRNSPPLDKATNFESIPISHSCSSLKASMETRNESDNEDGSVDNSMAIIPFCVLEEETKKNELKIVNKSVGEVLESLRHAREKIQSSLERRKNIIRVGPA